MNIETAAPTPSSIPQIPNNDRCTLVGAFSDHAQAVRALDRLMAAGLPQADAWLVENGREAEVASRDGNLRNTSAAVKAPEETHGFTAFLDRLFGVQDESPQADTHRNRVSSHSQEYLSRAYESNEHLLVVSTSSKWKILAKEILLAEHADIDEEANGALSKDFDDTMTMRLSEETLSARTERFVSGEVSLRKEVVTEMRTIEVPVSHEEIVIARRPLSGVATSSTLESVADAKPQELTVQLMEEQVIVEKKLVPKEEISISKRQIKETKQVSEEVRREEATIERRGLQGRSLDKDKASQTAH